MKILIGVIYGGRRENTLDLCKFIQSEQKKKSQHVIDCIIGINSQRPAEVPFPTIGYGYNIGHFPMANKIADYAIYNGYDYFVDINDDVKLVRDGVFDRIVEEFGCDSKVSLVTFRECIPNEADALDDHYAIEFASACFAVDLNYVKQFGLFDTRFYWYSGDSDLGWECWNRGYRIRWIENGWIHHDFACGRDLPLVDLDIFARIDFFHLQRKWKGKEPKKAALKSYMERKTHAT